ncbi:DPB11 [Candida theae]|uniref:DPB11 n=1 Tax=Candida theae TaxID=1198502 RepID=A0AAD5FXS3_9ASCO|nr:DPB11 [Candida theae]KAI5955394.1 DPB11 [Candida theae]
MKRYRRAARNSRAAILGSHEDFFAENASFDEYLRARYSQNMLTDEAALTAKRKKRHRATQFLKRYLQRIFHIKFAQKRTQAIYPVIGNAADIPDYETIVPAHHVTTPMATSPVSIRLINKVRGGIRIKSSDTVYLLSPVSDKSSVNSLFEDDHVSLRGTGATTADSNINTALIEPPPESQLYETTKYKDFSITMHSRKPFLGLTFCCTGVETATRNEIMKIIESMGGVQYLDLMSDVQYLIVANRKTQKYQFCVKNRTNMKYLTKDAIFKIHDQWLAGDDNVEKLLEEHTLPIFGEIRACFSRVEPHSSQVTHLLSASFRNARAEQFTESSLQKQFTKNGGHAKESLSNDQHCMISAEPRGTRYNKAVEWGIPVIHPVWIIDSLLRGAALDFDDYLLTTDAEEMYENGCNVWQELGNGEKRLVTKQLIGVPVEGPRKLNRGKRTEIWNSIMEHTNYEGKGSMTDKTWDEESDSENNEEIEYAKPVEAKSRSSLFLGFKFLLVGFTARESDLLSGGIEAFQGVITTDVGDKTTTHIIVPASKGSDTSNLLRAIPSGIRPLITSGDIKVVTEFFIERCIFYKKVVLDRWGQPIKGLLASSKRFKVSTSGFTGIELLHIEKLIKFLNFEYCESFSEQRDLLILNVNLFKESFVKNLPKLFQYPNKDVLNCPTYQSGQSSVSLLSAKNKIEAAKKWSIPIVSIAYLWEIFEKSQYKSALVMVELNDPQWCVHAPINYIRPKSLIEYIRDMDRSINSEMRKESEDAIRLPSPRKARQRQKYGKLMGSVSPSSMKSRIMDVAKSSMTSRSTINIDGEDENGEGTEKGGINCDVTNDEELSSQVRYDDSESTINQERLLKKLEEESPQYKREMTAKGSATKRRKTRGQ